MPKGPSLRSAFRWFRSRRLPNRATTSVGRWLFDLLHLDSRFLIDHFPRLGPVAVPLPNGRTLRLHAVSAESVSNLVYYRGWTGAEPEMAAEFWRHSMRARVVVDVGAHVGYYSLIAAHANPHARIEAFEALPAAADQFERHIAANGLENVKLHRLALTATRGTGTLYFTRAIPIPSSSGLSQEFHAGTPGLTEMTVELRPLDDVIERSRWCDVDIMKVDTEGTEPSVLRGALGVIDEGRPAIFCEVLPGTGTHAEIEALLGVREYVFHLLTTSGPIRMDHVDPDDEWHNWIFAPAGVIQPAR